MRRFFSSSFLIIAVCSIVGGLFGPGVTGVQAAGSEEELRTSLKNFTKVLATVEEHYADPVDREKAVYQGAIPGMLRTLDPHSSFFDPRAYALMREGQRGQYYGVGMSIVQRGANGPVSVASAFSGSPALKAGLRPGDTLREVNGQKLDGLTSTQVVDRLKGPRGTEVVVGVDRVGVDHILRFKVIRDEIYRKSVEDAFWLKPGILYLSITEFNENTSREMDENFKRVGEDKIKGLILDLRDNHGGVLQEGVAVTDHFLKRGQVVVSHKGRSQPERAYFAKHDNPHANYPIVVVVDRDTASAAEIVSGALQDHDRAWLIGERTFGKGLVQTVYNLPDSTGLALTTAHYYTPSGRLIQRDYSKGSFFEYYYANRDGKEKPPVTDDVQKTDSGRKVYGGNGIAPDEQYVAPKATKLQIEIYRRGLIAKFTQNYFVIHDPVQMDEDWRPSAQVAAEFRAYAEKEGVKMPEEDWTAAENDHWVKWLIRQEFFTTRYGFEQRRRVWAQDDPEIGKAIESLPKAQDLLDVSRKMTAQQLNKR